MALSTAWKCWGSVVSHSAIASMAIASVVSIQVDRLKQPSIMLETPKQAEQRESLRLDLLSKMPSFGFDNMVANWTFLNFVQYYGDEPARKETGYSLAPKYFEVLIDHDPRFVDVYMFVSATISHQLGKPELALEVMKRGTDALSPEMHPRAFSVWRLAGLDRILLLGDLPGAARSFEMTANWAAEGEEYKQFAPNFRATAKFLRTNPDIKFVQFQAWEIVYQDAIAVGDQQSSDRAKRKLLEMGAIEKKNEQGEPIFVAPKSLQEKRKR